MSVNETTAFKELVVKQRSPKNFSVIQYYYTLSRVDATVQDRWKKGIQLNLEVREGFVEERTSELRSKGGVETSQAKTGGKGSAKQREQHGKDIEA